MEGGSTESDQWRAIAAQKEREWKDITEQRIQSLESACQEKDKQLSEERSKFQKLKEDFKYNLRLLGERDQELDRYDATFADLKAQLNASNAEVSECKIRVDELRTQLAGEGKSREELQLHYQARLREKQAEIDAYRSSKDGELQEERSEFESFKRKLQRQLTQLEEESDAQKREITAGFEEAMRKREHEFRIQSDEMSAKVLEYELKAKLLGKELDLVKIERQKNTETLGTVETNRRALEKQLKERDWQIQDITSMKDATISDLENQVHQKELAMKRLQEDYERKHTELDKYCREKEGALTAAKDAFSEREAELQGSIRDLQSKLEDAHVDIRKLQWARQDTEKERNVHTEKLQEQIAQLKEKCDRQLADVSRTQVDKDLELRKLRETEDKLRLELVQKKEDIERYKKELSAAADREAGLERSKTQLELDWQRRYDDTERLTYEKAEDLVKKLTRARDEANAAVKEKQRELQQKDKLIRLLQTEREQALLTLKQNGIQLDKNIEVDLDKSSLVSGDEVKLLQDQNTSLRGVIREMRAQMEQLGHELPEQDKHSPRTTSALADDYVRDLEKECRTLRERNRQLEQDSDVARRFGRPPAPTVTNQEQVLSEVKDNLLVKNHIQSLNDLIGSLRAEKMELSAQVKKQQTHVAYQEQSGEKLQKQLRDKQVELDQLQYDLGALTRRSQTEIGSLKQKLSELELQLLEARKEADDYYRSNLERNAEVTALEQEVSSMKLQLAEKRPAINYGAQELLIQQLQGEIMSLKQQGAMFDGSESGYSAGPAAGGTQVQALQQKLRNAAKKITELARERQQLIEMGNKLRAELKKAGVEISSTGSTRGQPSRPLHHPIRDKYSERLTSGQPSRPLHKPIRDEYSENMTSSQPLSEKFTNKLNQLEKLQYQLTRQELQYAQKYQPSRPAHDVNNSGTSDTDEYRPPSILKKPRNLRDSVDLDVRASVNTEGGETIHSIAPCDSERSGAEFHVSLSSVGGESLQDIWKMLDDGRPTPTPRLSSPHRTDLYVAQSQESSDEMSKGLQLAGKPAVKQRSARQEKKLSDKAAGRVIKKVNNKPVVRNYNIKDDRAVR